MKITFGKEDFLKFFNMISVYRTYIEVADKEINLPESAIDLLIYRLADIIIENGLYETNLENNCFSIIQFMLGMGKYIIDDDVATAFNISNCTLTIDMKSLWDYLVNNGITI